MLPSGVDNFHKLVTYRNSEGHPYLFVDKTLFIKAFIDAGDGISLITRPRRFGKTLALSMLQHFLAKEVSGKPTKGLFDGLKISEHPEIMAYQGQSPVIFLTLKGVRGETFDEMFARMQGVMQELFQSHRYLLDTAIVKEYRVVFKRILDKKASQEEYESSLKFLSQLLCQHTGKQVMILLDEYDTPVHDAYRHGYYDKCKGLIAAMFHNAFKGNDALDKALITGILKVTKASFFSALNNVRVHTVLTRGYGQYFGFTEEETDDYLDRAGLPKKAHALKQMYNGYQIGDYTLYNPWSIVSFIAEVLLDPKRDMKKALKPYWINTGGTDIIYNLLKNNFLALEKGLELLIQNKPMKTSIYEEVIFNPKSPMNNVSFWSVMLLAGYLKVVEATENEYGEYVYDVLFPNQEIQRTFRRLLVDILACGRENDAFYTEGIRALAKGEVATFRDFLKKYVRQVVSHHDIGKSKEIFYHGLLVGIPSILFITHHITSNRESGDGRYDIAIEPKDPKKKGVILELKIAQEGEDLQAAAQRGCDQIMEKDYDAAMRTRGVKDFLYLGLAFRGKEVEVVSKRG